MEVHRDDNSTVFESWNKRAPRGQDGPYSYLKNYWFRSETHGGQPHGYMYYVMGMKDRWNIGQMRWMQRMVLDWISCCADYIQ